jgi:hypothetical protein
MRINNQSKISIKFKNRYFNFLKHTYQVFNMIDLSMVRETTPLTIVIFIITYLFVCINFSLCHSLILLFNHLFTLLHLL